jgi:primosomal protein N' (replication factor Y)
MKDGVEERWFVCSTSGERIRASENCPVCNSWKLRERGIGIQQVYDELHKLFPTIPVILFDHITARTYKKATFLRDSFYTEKGVILLGTQMALPYLTKEIDLSVVVNMDALLATPTWRLEEENLALLLNLREITAGTVYVQTRSPLTNVLKYAKQGSIEQFYTEELELRKTFNYPPYTTFIHFTWQGELEITQKLEALLTALFKDFNLSVYQNPTSPMEQPIMYGLIRVKAHEWPHVGLVALLKQVPPIVRVVINPDRIV